MLLIEVRSFYTVQKMVVQGRGRRCRLIRWIVREIEGRTTWELFSGRVARDSSREFYSLSRGGRWMSTLLITYRPPTMEFATTKRHYSNEEKRQLIENLDIEGLLSSSDLFHF